MIYGCIRSRYIGNQFSFEASFEEYDPKRFNTPTKIAFAIITIFAGRIFAYDYLDLEEMRASEDQSRFHYDCERFEKQATGLLKIDHSINANSESRELLNGILVHASIRYDIINQRTFQHSKHLSYCEDSSKFAAHTDSIYKEISSRLQNTIINNAAKNKVQGYKYNLYGFYSNNTCSALRMSKKDSTKILFFNANPWPNRYAYTTRNVIFSNKDSSITVGFIDGFGKAMTWLAMLDYADADTSLVPNSYEIIPQSIIIQVREGLFKALISHKMTKFIVFGYNQKPRIHIVYQRNTQDFLCSLTCKNMEISKFRFSKENMYKLISNIGKGHVDKELNTFRDEFNLGITFPYHDKELFLYNVYGY